jgi:hypothetical protein
LSAADAVPGAIVDARMPRAAVNAMAALRTTPREDPAARRTGVFAEDVWIWLMKHYLFLDRVDEKRSAGRHSEVVTALAGRRPFRSKTGSQP